MDDNNFRDTVGGALLTIGVALTGILTHLKRRSRKVEEPAARPITGNGNGNGIAEQVRIIGQGNQDLVAYYRERVISLEAQLAEKGKENEDLMEKLMQENQKDADLQATVKYLQLQVQSVPILEKQLAALQQQVIELQRGAR